MFSGSASGVVTVESSSTRPLRREIAVVRICSLERRAREAAAELDARGLAERIGHHAADAAVDLTLDDRLIEQHRLAVHDALRRSAYPPAMYGDCSTAKPQFHRFDMFV